jgi:hypothetical protein
MFLKFLSLLLCLCLLLCGCVSPPVDGQNNSLNVSPSQTDPSGTSLPPQTDPTGTSLPTQTDPTGTGADSDPVSLRSTQNFYPFEGSPVASDRAAAMHDSYTVIHNTAELYEYFSDTLGLGDCTLAPGQYDNAFFKGWILVIRFRDSNTAYCPCGVNEATLTPDGALNLIIEDFKPSKGDDEILTYQSLHLFAICTGGDTTSANIETVYYGNPPRLYDA